MTAVGRGRYTVSRHDAPAGVHFDLFLEAGEVLETYRLSTPPEENPSSIERILDHRPIYLDFEGELSDGRGRVAIHSKGTYVLSGDRLELERQSPSSGNVVLILASAIRRPLLR
jgi:hypothetical protein